MNTETPREEEGEEKAAINNQRERITSYRFPQVALMSWSTNKLKLLKMLFCKTMHYSLSQDSKCERHLFTTAKET